MSIKQRLVFLIASLLTAMVFIVAVMSYSLSELRIGSSMYQKIISDKDLLADILPPPEYIIESYLTVYQLLDDDHADKSALWQTLDRLKSEYETRKGFWNMQELPGNIRDALIASQEQADIFYQNIAALRQSNMSPDLINKIKKSYTLHRQAIDKLVQLTNSHFEIVTSESDQALINLTQLIIVAVLFILIASSIQAVIAANRINRPIAKIQAVVSQVSNGNFSTRAEVSGRDEMAVLGNDLNALISDLKAVIDQSILVTSNFAKGEVAPAMHERLPGDLGILAKSINQSVAQAQDAVAKVSSIMHAIKAGKLVVDWSGRGQYAHLQGAWYQMVADGGRW